MPDFVPFRGLRFDPRVVGDVGRVIAPPYDVIDAAKRAALMARSEHNIAHITVAEASDGYAAAAERLRRWRQVGVFRLDERPAFYVWEQRFLLHGREHRRTALVGLTPLDETGRVVMPHERTLDAPKADRLRLLTATGTVFGQVFALYQDPEQRVDGVCDRVKARPAEVDVVDSEDLGHRLWLMTDPADVREVRAALAGRPLLIADGHHRYATTLNFVRQHPELPAARWRMMSLVNMGSPGLFILPIHRLVRTAAEFNAGRLLHDMEEDFDLRVIGPSTDRLPLLLDAMAEIRCQGGHAFGMVLGDGVCRLAALRREPSAEAMPGVPAVLRGLDVAILHALVLERRFGIGHDALAAGGRVEYVKALDDGPAEAVRRVRSGEFEAALFLNPTAADQVMATAAAGEVMPQKSTFFYPKVSTGVVMHDLAVPVEAEPVPESGRRPQ